MTYTERTGRPDQTAGRTRTPRDRRVVAAVRILAGLFYVNAGLPKLTMHTAAVADFRHWGVPLSSLAAYAVGGLEVLGGSALVLGVAARYVAGLLAAEMIGAILTAGHVDGGQHLLLPPLLAAVTVMIAITGGGRWQLLRRWPPTNRLIRHPSARTQH